MSTVAKKKRRTLIFISILGFIFGLSGYSATSKDAGVIRSSTLERFSSTAHVQEDDTILITDTLYYNTDKVNGVNYSLNYSSLKNEKIHVERVLVNGIESRRIGAAMNGDAGVYTFMDSGEKQDFKIYEPNEGQMNIAITYQVQGSIKQYSDVQDFKWKIFDGKASPVVPLKLDATVSFPQSIGEDALKVFAHGDMASGSHFALIDRQTIKVEVTGFYKNTFAEVRALLQGNPLPHISNVSDEAKLEEFLLLENAEQEKTQASIAENKIKRDNLNRFVTISNVIWLAAVVGFFYVFRRFYESYDEEIYEQYKGYYREIPQSSPAVAALILNPKDTPNQKQLIATIFSLYTKRAIKLTMLQKDVQIELADSIENVNAKLTDDELFVYEWLEESFSQTRSGTYAEFFQIGMETRSTAATFHSKFRQFQTAVEVGYVELELESDEVAQDAVPGKMIIIGYLFIFYLLKYMVVGGAYLVSVEPLVICFLAGAFVLSRYKAKAYEFTHTGFKRKDEVHGLKNYLNDYSLLKDAESKAVYLWEQYFVYGLALNVSKKALHKLYQHMPQEMHEYTDIETVTTMYQLSHDYDIVRQGEHAMTAMSNTMNSGSTSRWSDDFGGSDYDGGGGFGGFSGGGGDGSGGATTSTF